jgi:hypothetical protein
MRCNRLKRAIREPLAFAPKFGTRCWKIAGRQIDPKTAEVCSLHRQVVDPYGVYPDLPDECDCVGRCYFARSPGSRVWIEFGDLPEATRDALWMRKRDSHLASIVDVEVPF